MVEHINDHVKYAQWGPVYYAEMVALQETAPEVYIQSLWQEAL